MNSQPHENGAPDLSGFAHLVTSFITPGAIACELAILAPPQPRPVEDGVRPGSSSRETPGMRTVGAGR